MPSAASVLIGCWPLSGNQLISSTGAGLSLARHSVYKLMLHNTQARIVTLPKSPSVRGAGTQMSVCINSLDSINGLYIRLCMVMVYN